MTTMLDKVAVAGDITQALDRRGVWTVAITIAGGESSTAVKLQTCDTADGVFEDFKELVSASSASTDQYKGFVIDLHGAKKFIKVTGATMATAVFGDCDHDIKDVVFKAGEVPSGGGDVENNKTATIDVSNYVSPVEIKPTSPNTSMKKATVTLTNVPSGNYVFYAWKEADSSGVAFYSLSETVAVGDTVYGVGYNTEDISSEDTDTVTAVDTETGYIKVTNSELDYERYSTGDITFTK